MSPYCRSCGSHVSEQYVRTFSRDGETVVACPDPDCPVVRDGRGRLRVEEMQKTEAVRADGGDDDRVEVGR